MASSCLCAGDLRHRVELQACTTTKDEVGGIVETWSTFATVWAQVRQATGRESWYRQQMNASGAWTISIRWRADLTTKHRVIYGTRVFEIRSATDEDQRKRHLMLACDEIIAP